MLGTETVLSSAQLIRSLDTHLLKGAKKCFFRKSDGGRETLEGWTAGRVC